MLLSLAPKDIASENITLSTYYPSPAGIYEHLVTTGDTYLARNGGNVSIGTVNPNVNAALDISSANKGLMLPRVDLGSAVFPGPGQSPAVPLGPADAGLLVFNTNIAFSSGTGVYAFDGAAWNYIGGSGGAVRGTVGGFCDNSTGVAHYPATFCSAACNVRGGTCPGSYYVLACTAGWTPFEGGAWNPGSVTYTSWSACIKN